MAVWALTQLSPDCALQRAAEALDSEEDEIVRDEWQAVAEGKDDMAEAGGVRAT